LNENKKIIIIIFIFLSHFLRMTNIYDERLIKYDYLAKEEADKNPRVIEEGEKALESIGFSKSKPIYSFVREMSRILGMTACRPATRIRSVACYFVAKQLAASKEFRNKFYKTTVNSDETVFNIDGKGFYSYSKAKSRTKKSNIGQKIKELETKSGLHCSDKTDESSFNFTIFDQFEDFEDFEVFEDIFL
jgi:hypothetical protein